MPCTVPADHQQDNGEHSLSLLKRRLKTCVCSFDKRLFFVSKPSICRFRVRNQSLTNKLVIIRFATPGQSGKVQNALFSLNKINTFFLKSQPGLQQRDMEHRSKMHPGKVHRAARRSSQWHGKNIFCSVSVLFVFEDFCQTLSYCVS